MVVLLVVWRTTSTFRSHKAVLPKVNKPMWKCSQVATQRDRRGQKNFDWKEDKVICSGWLNVSKDPINGANQSRSTFWSRVHAFFEEHKQTAAVRTESSIMHRWLTIQSQVNKYCCCYDKIERRNQSGKTIQDKIYNMCWIFTLINLVYLNRTFYILPNSLNRFQKHPSCTRD